MCHHQELVNKVKLADIFTRREGRTVRLVFDTENSRVILRSQSAEVGEHEGELKGEMQGTPMEIGFNAGYLIDALNSIDSEQARFKLQAGTAGKVSPAVITPEAAGSDIEYLHIVMPVRLDE